MIQEDIENGPVSTRQIMLMCRLRNLLRIKIIPPYLFEPVIGKSWTSFGWFYDFDVVMYPDSSDFSDAVILPRCNLDQLKCQIPK